MPFLGKQPTAGFASIVKDDLTADGSTTAFTLSKQVANANDIAVFVGNVRQEPTDAYTVNGTTLTMSAAPASAINFYVLHIAGTHESSVIPADGTISSAKLASNLVLDGNLTVDNDFKFTSGATPTLGVGTTTPNRKLHVYGNNASGAEISLTNTDMTADRQTQNFFMSGDKAHWRLLNDAGTAGGTAATLDWDGEHSAAVHKGQGGTAYGLTMSNAVGDTNVPNAWTSINTTYYRWNLPRAGIYKLTSECRVRCWGVTGIIINRLYNQTAGTAPNDIEGAPTTRLSFEDANNPNGHLFNVQVTHTWFMEVTEPTLFYHQFYTNNTTTSTSIQSDGNGYNIHYWERIG